MPLGQLIFLHTLVLENKAQINNNVKNVLILWSITRVKTEEKAK